MSEEKQKRVNLSDEEFIPIYGDVARNGGTVHDVSARTGMKPQSVAQRAKTLRDAGVPMPKLAKKEVKRQKRQRDIAKLTALLG